MVGKAHHFNLFRVSHFASLLTYLSLATCYSLLNKRNSSNFSHKRKEPINIVLQYFSKLTDNTKFAGEYGYAEYQKEEMRKNAC
jgi:hypothetical protein